MSRYDQNSNTYLEQEMLTFEERVLRGNPLLTLASAIKISFQIHCLHYLLGGNSANIDCEDDDSLSSESECEDDP